ncbi:MAG: cytidine deaminase [Acidobacteria bacterium]|nr:cytidine deaminase [Acidobacteriota bacterium]MBI3427323.1 cytidine deaminase [Acidobacteriota bacterium]
MGSSSHEQRKQAATRALVESAKQVRERAHAPFSDFKVGAALETADGRVFTGCNVENSSYGLSICAERVALFKAISEGVREFTRIAVIADTPAGMPVRPCGACRQVISDLMGGEAEVVMANLRGEIETQQVKELLPAPFDRNFL